MLVEKRQNKSPRTGCMAFNNEWARMAGVAGGGSEGAKCFSWFVNGAHTRTHRRQLDWDGETG